MKAEYDENDDGGEDQESGDASTNNQGGGGGGSGAGGNQRDRDRRGRGDRGTRFSDADPSNGGGGGSGRDRSRERRNCRIYVSNIPYDYRWQDLKDLFRRIVGSVEYVELFSDENGKARGCGIVEFKDPDNVEKALEKMNRYEINGREIVVKEDHGENRDQYGRIVRDGMGGGGGGGGGGGNRDRGGDRGGFSRRDRDDDRMSGRLMGGGGGGMIAPNDYDMPYNTYGLSTSFLESLGISGPLHTKVFVANLDYKVDSKKLKQVFKLAGKVQNVDLSVDKEGNSRGFAVIEYDHPVEAVQAISMLDRQMLFDRRMTVRLDRIPDKGEGIKLPDGLVSIGIGLGPNGEPLRDVARNLPNMSQNQAPSVNLGGGGGGGLIQNSAPVPVAPPLNTPSANLLSAVANTPVLSGLSNTHLAALSNVVGDLKNLTGVGGALSNRLLSSSLSSLGINLGGANPTSGVAVGGVGGVGDDTGNSSVPSANNYTTGNNYNSGYTSTSFNTGGGGRQDFDSSGRNYNTQQQQDGPDYGSAGNMFQSQLGGGRKSDTIVIKNIPLSCTWQTLRDKFRDIGEVKFAEIRGNDLGVVRFFKEKDAELAIKLMDGSRMDGRTVTVSFF